MSNSRKKDIIKSKPLNFTSEEAVKNKIPIQNFIFKTDETHLKWIENTTIRIAEWRQIFLSTYARWALSINGLNLANEKYTSPDFYTKKQFIVTSIRPSKTDNRIPERQTIITWDGITAGKQHLKSVNYISEFGIIDLYSALEEFVFDIYKIFLNSNPDNLIKGSEFKDLRKLFRERNNSEDLKKQWESEWEKRLSSWHRKRLYDGLSKVFLSYCKEANLKTPSHYKESSPSTWGDNIEFVALIRNHLVHGASKVDKVLGEFATNRPWIPNSFKEGDDLNLSLRHLESIELFTAQICDAVNFSLIEYTSKK
ncbi:hypothetical protein [Daejeonella sp. H1SJ63]|uniref:hypothetical protein n=1 Tax=Daejeonella sp. H1SJ63 TaxID=3034145 RepID=UPI0023EDE685|nr:hypothetical protein [Daejeonella sp. H1SJ63]